MKFFPYFLSAILLVAGIILLFNFQNKIKSLEENLSEQKFVKDSLEHELFKCNTALTRYQLATDILEEEDPAAAKSFEYILQTKTE